MPGRGVAKTPLVLPGGPKRSSRKGRPRPSTDTGDFQHHRREGFMQSSGCSLFNLPQTDRWPTTFAPGVPSIRL